MKTWGSETLTASDMTTYLTNNIEFLYGAVQGLTFSAVQVRRAASQSIPDTSATNVSFDTENLDYGGWWSSGTNIVTPAGAIPSGYTTVAVLVIASLKYAANGTGWRRIRVLKNGTSFASWTLSGITGETTDVLVTDVTTTAAADIFRLEAYQTSGGSLNITEAALTVIRQAPVV